jgi:glyoxylase-like metal-dependent hydrolase (beta-lactamase superfamily II)
LRCQDNDAVQVREIGTGLWYWTGLHPAWTAADGGPDGWAQEVGCVYYEGPDAVVLFDPLVPMEDPVRFYEALERDLERAGKPVRVLLTVDAHARSSQQLAERYDGTVAELPGGAPLKLPAGVELAAEALEEFVFWLPEHGALVAGDAIISRGGEVCLPRTWIGEERLDEAIRLLRPLLELPVERVLVTHGEPVLDGARESLARALAG